MEADLSKLLVDMIKNPPAGPVHRSFDARAIITITDLLQWVDAIVDILFYDDRGTPKDVCSLKKRQVKNIRDFLIDRNNRQVQDALDPSTFTFTKLIDFVA